MRLVLDDFCVLFGNFQGCDVTIAPCWVNLFPNDEVEKTCDLPENEKVVLMMLLGYVAEEAKPVEK